MLGNLLDLLDQDVSFNSHADVARKLFSLLWRGGTYAAFWSMRTRRTRWHLLGSELVIPSGCDIYFGVHPVASIPPRSSTGQDVPPEMVCTRNDLVQAVNCLYAEFDWEDFGTREAMLAHIDNLIFAPSYTQSSGGGVHAFWIFEKPIEITDEAVRAKMAQAQYDWVGWVKGDWGARDLRRILRVPGTYNAKLDPILREVVPMIQAFEGDGALYPSQLLMELLHDQYSRAKREDEDRQRRARMLQEATRPRNPNDQRDAGASFAKYMAGQTDHRNDKLNWAAHKLAKRGYTLSDIESALANVAVGIGLTEREVAATIRSAWGACNK